jgi:U-box domain
MYQPVVTSNGLSYDRESIMLHIKAHGLFDPITRKRILARFIEDNLLKEALVDHQKR